MRLKDAIDKVDRLKANIVDHPDKVDWISSLDGKVHEEILSRAADYKEAFAPYDKDSNPVLAVPFPYDDIYQYYLFAQIDKTNSEMESFNNNVALFNSEWNEFAAYYRRTHVPKAWRG